MASIFHLLASSGASIISVLMSALQDAQPKSESAAIHSFSFARSMIPYKMFIFLGHVWCSAGKDLAYKENIPRNL
ncbi:hypothetical protein CC78DRAFT_528658 [Lojkania enalia]|uniref:Uncharacterized protein n=1 Tax=Lojkania enalia TaxID=147567 RepID=A0A9P4NBG4_9PLEO|nr:hypothetical protein CC78DRAFT_528658 [Didymosphaeria enalia]